MSTIAAHEDTSKGGLGCPSLEVEHTIISVQRLTRALNDEGPLGRLTRALLQRQCSATDALSASQLPHVSRYCLRIRQAVAMQQAQIILKKEGDQQAVIDALAPLGKSLKAIAAEPSEWDKRLVNDIHTLHELGIANVENMLCENRQRVLQPTSMAMLVGKRRIKPKHHAAWRRIAHYLITGLPWREACRAPPEPHPRTLHEDFRTNLGARWPSNTTAWRSAAEGAYTNLHALSGMHGDLEQRAMQARNQLEEYLAEREHARPPSGKSYRHTVEWEDTRTDRRTTTGYTQYIKVEQAVQASRPSQPGTLSKAEQQRTALGEKYTHTEESIIAVKALCSSRAQQQAVVQWAPCVQPGWQIDLQRLSGYQHTCFRLAEHADLQAFGLDTWRPCEYCTQPATSTSDDCRKCTVCDRWYHTMCIRRVKGEEHTGTPETYTCAECTATEYTTDTIPPAIKLYYVEWGDATEAISTIRNSATPQALQELNELLATQACQAGTHAKKQRPNPGQHANIMPRDKERVYDVTIGQAIRKKLVIHTQPINPHADIAPAQHEPSQTGCRLFMRPVRHLTPAGTETTTELCCIYGTDGRCEHMIAPEVVARLKDAFTYMQANHPERLASLQAGTFEQEVRRLAIRYRPVPGTKTTAAQHWTVPRRLKHTIMRYAKLTQERFTNPFTAHPCSSSYWTAHERDQVFGAGHDAYSVRWTGASLAIPNFEVHAATKAMDWAIRSAKSTEEATITLLLLPTFYADDGVDTHDDAAYMQLMRRNQDVCLPICTFGREVMQLEPPGCQPLADPHVLKWKFRLVAVGNSAGYVNLIPGWLDHAARTWLSDFNSAIRPVLPPSTHQRASVTFEKLGDIRLTVDTSTDDTAKWARKAGTRFQKRHADTAHAVVLPRPRAYHTPPQNAHLTQGDIRTTSTADHLTLEQLEAAHHAAIQDLRRTQPPPPPLIHDWQTFLYTDGSHIKDPPEGSPGIGAAVHVPGPDAHTLAVACAWGGEGSDPTCNTICRAELAALHVAISQYGAAHKRADGTLHVATDSLGSMYGLAKIILRPQDLQEHRHRRMLDSMAKAVQDYPGTIHLWKVKSHTGIIGNERADEVAVQVAKGEYPSTHPRAPHNYETPSNTRMQSHWPYKQTERERPSGEIVKVVTPLPDMQASLKQVAHAHAKYGSASKTGVYASSWLSIADKLHHPASHTFLGSSKANTYTKKLVLQYRWGLLPTNRYLHKIGKAPSNHCPMCGEEDGGHHVISGCRELSAAYTRRHNDAGTEILEAISRGKKASHVFLSDVGFTKRRSAAERPDGMQPHRFMRHMDAPQYFSPDQAEALRNYSASVPDIIMLEFDADAEWTFNIIEIKYCRDTDPTPQQQRATEQHAALKELILSHEPRATIYIVPLLLGASGVIYNSFMKEMRDLGVDGSALASLARRLHFIAINNLKLIWQQRCAIVLPRDRRKRKQCNRRQGHKHHKGQSGTGSRKEKAQQGTKRPRAVSAPDHRKRRKQR
jgi:ribonuclease HI